MNRESAEHFAAERARMVDEQLRGRGVYHAALLGALAREVISIERIPELAAIAMENCGVLVLTETSL